MLPIYDVICKDENEGMTAISFVDEPAILQDFVYFNKQNNFYLSNNEKREVVSPILIPNQLIYRRDNEMGEYYIRWKKETIKQIAEKYVKNQYYNNFTIMHPMFYDDSLTYSDVLEKDIYCLRMWITESKDDEINTKYGFNDLPEGTLCVHLKIHNRKLWNRIKSGELRGLSIEAFCNLEKINQTKIKQNKMAKFNNLFEKFVAFMNENNEEILDSLKEDNTDSALVEIKYYLDNEKYIYIGEDGKCYLSDTNEICPSGEYSLSDGNIIVVGENNEFVETKAEATVAVEPVEAPIAEEEILPEEPAEEEKPEDVDVDELLKEIEELKAKIEELEIENTVLKEENDKLSEEGEIAQEKINQMSQEPSVKPVVLTPNETNSYAEMIARLNRYNR